MPLTWPETEEGINHNDAFETGMVSVGSTCKSLARACVVVANVNETVTFFSGPAAVTETLRIELEKELDLDNDSKELFNPENSRTEFEDIEYRADFSECGGREAFDEKKSASARLGCEVVEEIHDVPDEDSGTSVV